MSPLRFVGARAYVLPLQYKSRGQMFHRQKGEALSQNQGRTLRCIPLTNQLLSTELLLTFLYIRKNNHLLLIREPFVHGGS